MNRQYGRDDFLGMIERVRAGLSEPAISTDIIVGFPDETDQAFQETVEVARQVGFLKIHAFPFSPRQRTAAARWTSDFVGSNVVRQRMKQLAGVERDSSVAFRRKLLGRVERIMVERVTEPWDAATPRICSGRADRYFEVHIECDDTEVGDVVRVRLDRVTPTRTHGTRIDAATGRYPLPVLEMSNG